MVFPPSSAPKLIQFRICLRIEFPSFSARWHLVRFVSRVRGGLGVLVLLPRGSGQVVPASNYLSASRRYYLSRQEIIRMSTAPSKIFYVEEHKLKRLTQTQHSTVVSSYFPCLFPSCNLVVCSHHISIFSSIVCGDIIIIIIIDYPPSQLILMSQLSYYNHHHQVIAPIIIIPVGPLLPALV